MATYYDVIYPSPLLTAFSSTHKLYCSPFVSSRQQVHDVCVRFTNITLTTLDRFDVSDQ